MAHNRFSMNFKPLVHKLGLGVLNAGEKWFQIPDLTKAELRGRKLSRFAFRLDKKHRNRSKANLALAFPERSEAERDELCRKMVDHFGFILADFVRSPIRGDEEFLASMEIEGREIFERVVAEGKGIIAVTGHLGNWERSGQLFPVLGVAAHGIARDANDDEITTKVNSIRSARGLQVLSRGNAIRETLLSLRKGDLIVIMPDQNDDKIFIPFFGHPAGTVTGPAVLHQKTGSPILPFCILRSGPGQYRAIFHEPIVASDDDTPETLMTRINEELEAMIRLAPEKNVWMHDRWKNARRQGLL